LAAAGTVDEDNISQDKCLAAIYRRTSISESDARRSFRMKRASTVVGNGVKDSKMNFGTGAAWVPSRSLRELLTKEDDEEEEEEATKKLKQQTKTCQTGWSTARSRKQQF
jgi:hypothetical protein